MSAMHGPKRKSLVNFYFIFYYFFFIVALMLLVLFHFHFSFYSLLFISTIYLIFLIFFIWPIQTYFCYSLRFYTESKVKRTLDNDAFAFVAVFLIAFFIDVFYYFYLLRTLNWICAFAIQFQTCKIGGSAIYLGWEYPF